VRVVSFMVAARSLIVGFIVVRFHRTATPISPHGKDEPGTPIDRCRLFLPICRNAVEAVLAKTDILVVACRWQTERFRSRLFESVRRPSVLAGIVTCAWIHRHISRMLPADSVSAAGANYALWGMRADPRSR
jgi:hypothetical protein